MLRYVGVIVNNAQVSLGNCYLFSAFLGYWLIMVRYLGIGNYAQIVHTQTDSRYPLLQKNFAEISKCPETPEHS